ncbi:MAG: metalloregulator ArsR/SmtB family transcription factor [Acidobacteriota bacterium]
MRVTPGPVGPRPGASCGAASLPATDAGCEEVATRFRALSEPTRLKILRRLARGGASVGEVVADVGGTQANVSKHLAVLLSSDIVGRKRQGGRTLYAIADPALLSICSIVCEGIERAARARASEILGTAPHP